MRRKKVELKYKKERVLFSDVLPYETPLIFSNRHFYEFLVKNKIEINGEKIVWDNNIPDDSFESMKLILGLKEKVKKEDGNCSLISKDMVTIPFVYKIAHKEESYRELSIIHPLNQLQIVEFYEKNKSLILHYCSQSNFSIRHADKVACYFYFKDRLHEQLLGKKVDSKEEYLSEYENLKSYFSYQAYSNIYKFYEDYHYQRAEKKFNKLLKLDIQSCFDSIYTHSIAWATLGGKQQVKNHLSKISNTFGDDFDKLMQRMNYNETNGILIGPEFSRIFAEIILQHIDKTVENKLIDLGKFNHIDYECFRYVDDYFIFFNNENTKKTIVEQLTFTLKEFKMSISESKKETFEKPFITDVTIAKLKIDELFSEHLKLKIGNSSGNKQIEAEVEDDTLDEEKEANSLADDYNINFKIEKLKDYLNELKHIYINANSFNARYKMIIKESNVEYKNILNYTLAIFLSKIEVLLKKFDKRFRYLCYYSNHIEDVPFELRDACINMKNQDEKHLTSFITNAIDIAFFLYSNNKRINTTLKILSILNVIILYYKNNYKIKDEKIIRFNKSYIETVFKKIQDEIDLVMQCTNFNKNTQLESFYLLLAIKEFGREYLLKQDTINKYLGITDNNIEKTKPEDCCWNALLISVLLHYYSNEIEFISGRKFLQDVIFFKIKSIDLQNRRKSSELCILTMDIMTCPFLEDDFKKQVLCLFDITLEDKQNLILNNSKRQRSWFIKWIGFNLNYEINAKVSQEVYS